MGINVKRRRSDNIWLFDYTSLLSLSGDQDKLLFVSERDINMVYQGLKDIDRYITRVFTEVNGDVYTSVDFDQFEVFKQWQNDLFNNIGDWRMTNEILQGILEAVQALEGSGCGCAGIEGSDSGSGGAGTGIAPESPVTTTAEDRLGDPPPGHASWSEYDQYKCDAAQYTFDQLLIDVATAGAVDVGLFGAIELAGLLVPLFVTPIGWVALLGVAAIMIQATALAIAFSLIVTHLEAFRDEYICAILLSTDVAAAITNFNSKVDELLPGDTGFTDPVIGYVASNFVKSFSTVDSFNRLFSKVAGIPEGGDCSACDVVLVFPSTFGGCTPTIQSGSLAGTFVVRSCAASVAGTTRSQLVIATTETGLEREFTNPSLVEGPDRAFHIGYVNAVGATVNLDIAGISGFPNPLIAEAFQIYSNIPSDADPFDLQITVAAV